MTKLPSSAIDRVCRFAYVAALCAGLLLLLLARLQQTNNSHVNVFRKLSETELEFHRPNDAASREIGFALGQSLRLYRFNDSYREPLGQIYVSGVTDDFIRASFDPKTFNYAVALQGTVSPGEKNTLRLNVGSKLGLAPNTTLYLFDGTKNVGSTRVVSVEPESAVLERPSSVTGDVTGLTASQFTVPDRITLHRDPGFDRIVIGALLALGLVLAAWLLVPGRIEPPVLRTMARVRAFWSSAKVQRVGVWLLGIPAAYVVGKFCLYVVPFLLWRVNPKLVPNGWAQLYNTIGGPAIWALAILYYTTLWNKKRSPILLVWERLRFQPPKYEWLASGRAGLSDKQRRLADWALHLVVAWAFASMLYGFLKGNLAAIANAAYRGRGLDFSGDWAVWKSVGRMLVTAPVLESAPDFFAFFRLLLFSVAIASCIMLYMHTVVTAPFMKTLHNVDFTLAGWVTNSVCYSSLIGPVVWTMAPTAWGADPGVTDSALFWAIPAAELFLNIVYTLSLFNLGTMFGVMVDKGVRTRGFYSVVRHPSYTVESVMFMLTGALAATTWVHYFGLCVYCFIYWVRSEREDQFMAASNPEYLEYQKQVPYKFIPGLY